MWLLRYIWFSLIMGLLTSLVVSCEAAQTESLFLLSSMNEIGSRRQIADCNDAFIYYDDGGTRLVRVRREDGAELARMPVTISTDVVAWGDYVITTGYAHDFLERGTPEYSDMHIILWPQDFTEESEPLAMFRLQDWEEYDFYLTANDLFGPENAGGDFLAICEAQEMLEVPQVSCTPLDETGETAMLRYGDAEIPIAPYRNDASLLRRAYFEEETGILYLMFVADTRYYAPINPHTGEQVYKFPEYDMSKAEGCMVMRVNLNEKRVIDTLELPHRKEAVFHADSTGIYSYNHTKAQVRHTLWDGTDAFIGDRIACERYSDEPRRLYVEVCGGYALFFSEGAVGLRTEADGTQWKNPGMLSGMVKLSD